jgi:putative ABC transport system permease protein
MMSDLRYALRAFARVPGFSLVAILTLALGIGATTAIFSVVNGVLLQPLPYSAPDRLVVAHVSLPDLHDVAAESRSFEGVGAWASNLYNLETNGESRQITGGVVSPELLPLLGVTPFLGRNFTVEDNQTDTVILGYGLWQSSFGGDPGVLGRTITLTGSSYTVVGVAPPWFRFPSSEYVLWTSLGGIEAKAPAQARNRALRIFNMLARLEADVTMQQADADVTAIGARLAKTYPQTNTDVRIELTSLYDRLVGDVRTSLVLLLGAVGLLLLIACANVANLMLARTTVRERELSIRTALGAGRARLARQLAVESLVLAVSGGVIGVLVAMWGVDLLPSVLQARLPRADRIRIDAVVLLFAGSATVLTALFFGIAPALQAMSGGQAALNESGRAASSSPRGRRVRRVIVVAEIALAVVVVVGAGLMTRSFVALIDRDLGFNPSHLLTFNVQLVKLPDGAARSRAMDGILEQIARVPGVEAAGGATGFPIVTAQRGTSFAAEGRTLTADQGGALFIAASPDYFHALATPLLRGRAFTARDDAGSAPVVIVNRTMAETIFAGVDPVGRRVKLVNPEQSDDWRTIVGVVGDLYYRGGAADAAPTIYTPFAQTPFLWSYVMVRTTGDPRSLTATLRSLVPSVDSRLTAANIRPMRDVLVDSVAEPRLTMMLTAGFGLLALLLAGVGIYGVISYTVAQRTREIGIRRALGARVSDVLRLVVGEGLALAAIGVALGLAGAAAMMQWTATLLVGVTARDPLTYAGVGLILLTIAALASWVPARRAIRVEPVTALRHE